MRVAHSLGWITACAALMGGCAMTTPGGLKGITLIDVDGLPGGWTYKPQRESTGNEVRSLRFERVGKGRYVSTSIDSIETRVSDFTVFDLDGRIVAELLERDGPDGSMREWYYYGLLQVQDDTLSMSVVPTPFPPSWSHPEFAEMFGGNENTSIPMSRRTEALSYLLTETARNEWRSEWVRSD